MKRVIWLCMLVSHVAHATTDEEKKCVEAFTNQMRTTTHPLVRNVSALTLADIGNPNSAQEIANMLRDNRTLGQRGTLVYALSHFDCSPYMDLLLEEVAIGTWESSQEAFLVIKSTYSRLDLSSRSLLLQKAKKYSEDSRGDRLKLLRQIIAMLL